MHVEEVKASFFKVVLEILSTVEEDCMINALFLHIKVDSSSISEGYCLINALDLT